MKTVMRLNDGQLGGSNVESVNVSGQSSKGLLGAVGSDQGVDSDTVDIVELLKSIQR